MTLLSGVLLLQAIILLTLINPTEYSEARRFRRQSGNKKNAVNVACPDFQTPEREDGYYDCTRKGNNVHCMLSCNSMTNGIELTVSNIMYANEVYRCKKGQWMRNNNIPSASCIAKVKEVNEKFHKINEDVNILVRDLLTSSYNYLDMASFFERADVDLPGFNNLMVQLWQSEMKNAQDLMSYINKRGGYIDLQNIPTPETQKRLLKALKPGIEGLTIASQLTKDINRDALNLHKKVAESDAHLKHVLEDGIISQKINNIKKLEDVKKQLTNFVDAEYDIGEYLVDLEIRKGQGQVNA